MRLLFLGVGKSQTNLRSTKQVSGTWTRLLKICTFNLVSLPFWNKKDNSKGLFLPWITKISGRKLTPLSFSPYTSLHFVPSAISCGHFGSVTAVNVESRTGVLCWNSEQVSHAYFWPWEMRAHFFFLSSCVLNSRVD